jgi:glutathione S-transferase
MKFYNSIGPNPRVVKMFMAEKGIDIPRVEVDLRAGENRQPAYLAEVTAICEYLEELHPTPVLIGATPEERAMTRMWTRRVDLYIVEPMLNGFRAAEGFNFFKERMRLLPQAAADLKTIAQEKITWLDQLIGGREYIGDRFSLADILLYCTMDFAQTVGQPVNRDNANISSWFDRVNARPSAEASRK